MHETLTQIELSLPAKYCFIRPDGHKGEPWNEREVIEAAQAESRAGFPVRRGRQPNGMSRSTLDHRIATLKINKRRLKFD